jgi:hypothetical protein
MLKSGPVNIVWFKRHQAERSFTLGDDTRQLPMCFMTSA